MNRNRTRHIFLILAGTWVVCALFFAQTALAGCVSGDCSNGKGEYTYDNGDRYVGENRADQAHGYGNYYWANSETYEGYWEGDQKNGVGVFKWKSGAGSLGCVCPLLRPDRLCRLRFG